MAYKTWLNPDFGPFDPLFPPPSAGLPGHLSLLHLFQADDTVARITATVRSGDCGTFVRRLFESPDWRPHLVGAVACIAEPDPQWLGWLWQAIDGGSWVTPQLAVAAYLTDPEFLARARSRLEAHCPVPEPDIPDDAERYFLTGPGDAEIRSAKMVATLLALCGLIADDASWVAAARSDPAIAELLRVDAGCNGSGDIALRWLNGIGTVFRRLRVRLRLQPVVTEFKPEADPALATFGPFARFLEVWYSTEPSPTPPLDHLLFLFEDACKRALDEIAGILRQGDCRPWVRALFESPDWRAHLLGAFACLVEPDPEWLGWLWRPVDGGSLITPQLAVVAYLGDPEFAARARARIEARCPVAPPPEDESGRGEAADPEGGVKRSAMLAASLLDLCERSPALAPWAAAARKEPEIARLLRVDLGVQYPQLMPLEWLDSIDAVLRNAGIRVGPRLVDSGGEAP